MTDLTFNELSVNPPCETRTAIFHRIEKMIETFKAANEFNFNRIRFDEAFDQIFLSVDCNLNDFCNEHKTIGTLLHGLARYPFIDDDSDEEERFIDNSFFVRENGKKINTNGLAAAYLYSTMGIGFVSNQNWAKISHTLIIEGKEKRSTIVLCASDPNHFKTDEFLQWFDDEKEIELIKCDIPADKKKISLRDDHGKDKLLKFSKIIIKSPYVISVINSLQFNPFEKKFIKKIYPTGIIYIILTDTDMGLGMAIKTTGRNLNETTRIAEIIMDQYE